MVSLGALWLPVLVSSVVVFIVSSIIHMASPWHKGDYPRIPKEDEVMAALRPLNIPPGGYMVPRPASQQDMRSPAFLEKMNAGPVLMLQVMPNGMMPMTKNLVNWFIYIVVVGLFAAIITKRTAGFGANYRIVFQLIGATAFIGYSLALWQMSIWYRRGWMLTIKATIDGLIYASLTAGIFGWLWPR
jgi:hypothetical protein